MEKDQVAYMSENCKCDHQRGYHNGIEGFCYVGGCKCMKFVKIEGVKSD